MWIVETACQFHLSILCSFPPLCLYPESLTGLFWPFYFFAFSLSILDLETILWLLPHISSLPSFLPLEWTQRLVTYNPLKSHFIHFPDLSSVPVPKEKQPGAMSVSASSKAADNDIICSDSIRGLYMLYLPERKMSLNSPKGRTDRENLCGIYFPHLINLGCQFQLKPILKTLHPHLVNVHLWHKCMYPMYECLYTPVRSHTTRKGKNMLIELLIKINCL